MWKSEGVCGLWHEALCAVGTTSSRYSHPTDSVMTYSIKHARTLAREGSYGKAVKQLASNGNATYDDDQALTDLLRRHPQKSLPATKDIPTPLAVSTEVVLSALKRFPRGSSPGASRLRIQHLLGAICGTTAPASSECLVQLTKWLNQLLSGTAHSLLAPWLCGAPLTALKKPNSDGYRPIAVGEVYRRLASRLACEAVRHKLPSLLLPYGQVGVGIKGGLEAVIHSLREMVEGMKDDGKMCILKLDFMNVFNECDRSVFFGASSSIPPRAIWLDPMVLLHSRRA